MKTNIKNCMIGLSIAGLALLNLSCEVSEPDRFYDNSVVPPQAGEFTLDELKGTTIVYGTETIRFTNKDAGFNVHHADLYVDSEFYSSDYEAPFELSINTLYLRNGLHNIELLIYKYPYEMNHGVLNLVDPPSLVIDGKIKVDNTPPSPVTVSFKGYSSGHPVIGWTKSTSARFAGYVIEKVYGGYTYEFVDTVYDRATLTYTDMSNNFVYGNNYSYSVFVMDAMKDGNVGSNSVTISAGRLALDFYQSSYFCNSESSELIYYGGSTGYGVAASISADKTNRKMAAYDGVGYLVYNESKSEIYGISMSSNRIYAFDLNTFTLKRTMDVSFESGLNSVKSCVGNNEIFLNLSPSKLGRLNTETGVITNTIEINDYIKNIYSITVSNDKSKLYVSSSNLVANFLMVFDISGPEIKLLTRKNIGSLMNFIASSDNDFLYEIDETGSYHNKLCIRDGSTLEVIKYVSMENNDEDVYSAFIRENSIYVSTAYSIVELDKTSLAQKRKWETSSFPRNLFVTNDNKYLYFTIYYGGGHQLYKINIQK